MSTRFSSWFQWVAALVAGAVAHTATATDLHLYSLSARGQVGTGSSVMISGFSIPAGASKTMLLRAAGPSLSSYGVSGVLANPLLEVYNAAGTKVTSNDDWSSALSSTFSAAGAFSFTTGALDSALVATLEPGNYTAVVSGVGSTTGVSLVEFYDISGTATPLYSISTRGQVGTGDNVLITGFSVTGDSTTERRRLLLRGVGPTLANYGVSSSALLANPQLTLYDASGAVVAVNDDWGTVVTPSSPASAVMTSVMSTAGAFAYTGTSSQDAALLVDVPAGNYTAVIKGVNDTTGVALAEVYDVGALSVGPTTPWFTVEPASTSVAVGTSVTLRSVASGSGTLSYQWNKAGTAINGATANTYTIASPTTSDAGVYTVTATNAGGSVTSSAATLTVTSTTTASNTAAVVAAANAFAATLTTSQQSSFQLAWSLTTARHWSNLPAASVSRNGVAWSALSTTQRTAATTLINSALSTTGLTLWQGLQAADDYLNANGGGSSYGAGTYYISVLGTPSTTSFWLLQLTGHHITYNIAFNGTYQSPTPLFLAIEPKGSFTQSGTTYDPMQAQREAVAALVAALPSYSGSALSGTYSDVVHGANGTGNIDGTYPKSYPTGTSGRGVLYASLSTADQAKVQTVIKSYVNTQATECADALLTAYLSDAALAETYVAYAGTAGVTTRNSYIRVDGPRVWIEFSVQNGVIFSSDIHYHTIWRDKLADYGGNF